MPDSPVPFLARDTTPMARLLLPSPALGGCIHLGVERNTRGCDETSA